MLDKIMALLKRNSTVTIDQMARELDTSPEMVSGMIDHMTRQGWLRSMSASCDTGCGECLFARDCTQADNKQVWLTTGDGHQPRWNG